jgi:hypothetical protein
LNDGFCWLRNVERITLCFFAIPYSVIRENPKAAAQNQSLPQFLIEIHANNIVFAANHLRELWL